jgi:hypothetical protein
MAWYVGVFAYRSSTRFEQFEVKSKRVFGWLAVWK